MLVEFNILQAIGKKPHRRDSRGKRWALDLEMFHVIRVTSIVLLFSAGVAHSAQPSQADVSTRLSAARVFLVAAEGVVNRIGHDQEREALLYDLAGMQAMIGDIAKAKATAGTCSVTGRRSEIYCYIGELQGELGDKEGARQTLLLARKAALAARAAGKKDEYWLDLGSLAIDHARIGDFQGASEVLQLIEDAKERDSYQTSIASFQPKQEAKKTIQSIKDPFQKDLAQEDIVKAELESGDRAAAWASTKEIRDLGLRVSGYIMIAETAGNRDDAKRAYACAKATAEEIKDPNDRGADFIRPAPGDHEFHNIAASQARTGDVAGAKTTAAMIRDETEKAMALVGIAQAQLDMSDRRGALTTLKDAVPARTTATDDYDLMQELAAVLAKAGELPEAMKTISLMSERGEPKDHAYEAIVDILLDQHKTKQAKEVIALIRDPRWKATALARIGAAKSRAGDVAEARRTFAEARMITATVPEKNAESWTWDRSSVYHYVAMRQSETGDFDEIKRWVPLVEKPRDRVSAWLGAAWPLAHQYFDERQERAAKKRVR